MPKPIEDLGSVAAVDKPLRLRSYVPAKVPDAAACVNALIIINDSKDGSPRGRIACSNGASWDHIAWLDEGGVQVIPPPVVVRQQTVDVTPMVQQAVAEMLPALLPKQVPALPAPARPLDDADSQTLAAFCLEMAEQNRALQAKVMELERRIAFVEEHALAKVELKGVAA